MLKKYLITWTSIFLLLYGQEKKSSIFINKMSKLLKME